MSFIISFEFFQRKIFTDSKKSLIEPLTFNNKQWSAVHSYRKFIFKYLINIWKKRTQVKNRRTYSWKFNQKKNICYIIGFLKRKYVPASFPFILLPFMVSVIPHRWLIFKTFLVDSPRPRTFSKNLRLLTLHFSTPKISVSLTSWGRRVTRINKLIDCSLKTKLTAYPKFTVMFWLWN